MPKRRSQNPEWTQAWCSGGLCCGRGQTRAASPHWFVLERRRWKPVLPGPREPLRLPTCFQRRLLINPGHLPLFQGRNCEDSQPSLLQIQLQTSSRSCFSTLLLTHQKDEDRVSTAVWRQRLWSCFPRARSHKLPDPGKTESCGLGWGWGWVSEDEQEVVPVRAQGRCCWPQPASHCLCGAGNQDAARLGQKRFVFAPVSFC